MKQNSLSQTLKKTWQSYEGQVHLSRTRPSTRNIHELRVSTQKLEAVLTLAHSLRATHHSKNIISLIKKVRKSLGPLRDIQVESPGFSSLGVSQKTGQKRREFSAFFADQKNRAKRKAERCLNDISLGSERKRVGRIAAKIEQNEQKYNRRQIQLQLDAKLKADVLRFNAAMKTVNPERLKDIHRFRILAKKLRYQSECRNALIGTAQFNLDDLKQIQTVAGRIQNDSILIETLDRFLHKKKHSEDPKALKLRKRIELNQLNLIKKDFSLLTNLQWRN